MKLLSSVIHIRETLTDLLLVTSPLPEEFSTQDLRAQGFDTE